MTLPQAIEYSLKNNGDLAAYRQEKGIAEAGRVRAGLLPNPTLDLEAGTGALTGSSDESTLAVGISQEFLLAGKREKRLAVADREMEGYRWQVAERERVLREEVALAFYDTLLAKERLGFAGRSITLNRQLLEVARERLAAGDIPELEMNLVKVEVARSEGAKIEAARALLQSEAKLGALLGGSGSGTPAVAGTLSESAPLLQRTLAELLEGARANRPDLKALEAERRKGEAEITLARAERVPNLTAGVEVRRETSSMEIGGVEGKETAYTVGVRLSIPIPAFDRNEAPLREATARVNISDSRLAAAVRRAELEVESAYATWHNADAVLSLYSTGIVPQLEENLALTREAYRLGEVGILAIIQEHKKFFEVGEAYLAALHDRQVALVKLQSAAATDLMGGGK